MKIVIFAGGSGSVALQSGLFQLFGPQVEYSIITNLLDNGLSTGVCRMVMDGEILGPSDLRKNQLLRNLLMYGNSRLHNFLELRITKARDEIEDYLINELSELTGPIVLNGDERLKVAGITTEQYDILLNGVLTFFAEPKSHEIEYVDFSVANIIYSGLARDNDNSMVAAGNLMAKVLKIPQDAVICASDHSLYLTARTVSGHTILDEGDIVDWCNPNDRIISTSLLNNHGTRSQAILTQQALEAIQTADLIIYSSGTQWSSLIPTYEMSGFTRAIEVSDAKQYLVMNVAPDKDTYGVDGNEMLDILGGYLNLAHLTVVAATTGEMQVANRDHVKVLRAPLEAVGKRHNPEQLIKTIFNDYFANVLAADHVSFDFDDTVMARDGQLREVSEENVGILSTFKNDRYSICTGNSAKSILIKAPSLNTFTIYSERGANLTVGGHVTLSLLKHNFTESEVSEIVQVLKENGISLSKIQNRNNTIIAIKPIADDYRLIVLNLLKLLFPNILVMTAGKTTIEISELFLDKNETLPSWLPGQKIAYVGDEWRNGGNDAKLYENPKITFVPVNSVKDTNILLKVLRWRN